MDRVKPSLVAPPPDAIPISPERNQLRPPDDTVLLRSDSRDPGVEMFLCEISSDMEPKSHQQAVSPLWDVISLSHAT